MGTKRKPGEKRLEYKWREIETHERMNNWWEMEDIMRGKKLPIFSLRSSSFYSLRPYICLFCLQLSHSNGDEATKGSSRHRKGSTLIWQCRHKDVPNIKREIPSSAQFDKLPFLVTFSVLECTFTMTYWFWFPLQVTLRKSFVPTLDLGQRKW